MNDLAEIISQNEDRIRAEWVRTMSSAVQRADLISKAELDEQCGSILKEIVDGVRTSGPENIASAGWNGARELLTSISSSRARQGFSPIDVAMFVLSLKQPLFVVIREKMAKSPDAMFETVWSATQLLDRLALITTESYTATREELIMRQQQELLELSTPVVKLWDGILALPIIGTLEKRPRLTHPVRITTRRHRRDARPETLSHFVTDATGSAVRTVEEILLIAEVHLRVERAVAQA